MEGIESGTAMYEKSWSLRKEKIREEGISSQEEGEKREEERRLL